MLNTKTRIILTKLPFWVTGVSALVMAISIAAFNALNSYTFHSAINPAWIFDEFVVYLVLMISTMAFAGAGLVLAGQGVHAAVKKVKDS